MDLLQRVKATPKCDRPVADRELSGAGNFVGLFGGEHIAATEFVIGATLVQYGCSATDLIIGLAIGNLLAVLSFTFLCSTIATDTRLTLYTYLHKIFGKTMQKVYNVILGVGLSALAAAGIGISATAIRRVFSVPIQHEWYPTSIKFILIVLIIGAVITFIAAKGFEAVAKFASTCVPWMIGLFFMGFVITLPQLLEATGSAPIKSIGDFMQLMNTHVWVEGGSPNGQQLGLVHVIGFAWVCNLAWHVGLNDMSIMRFAKNYKYGLISSVGMYIGHFCAWIIAGIMGAAASIVLNIPLGQLDSGEVTYTLLGYAGLLAVIIAGWTTANPTIYRITLSFNVIFKKISRQKLTYIVGAVITVVACFPFVQRAADILTFLGLAVEGVGAICITEHYLFPKIGFTRYWNLYRKKNINWAATISWAASLIFTFSMVLTGTIHQNIVFVPAFFVTAIIYLILAGLMGARQKYLDEEKEQQAYERALQEYVNERSPKEEEPKKTPVVLVLRAAAFVILAVMVVMSLLCAGNICSLQLFKLWAIILSLSYFVCNGVAMAMIYHQTAPKETGENEDAAGIKNSEQAELGV